MREASMPKRIERMIPLSFERRTAVWRIASVQGTAQEGQQRVGHDTLAKPTMSDRNLRIPAVHTRREYLRGGDMASTRSGAGSTAMVSPLGMNGADSPVAVPSRRP